MFRIEKGVPPQEWDDNLIKLGGHFLQSRSWAMFQEALYRPVLWCHGDQWSWVATKRQGRGVNYLMVPYGPAIVRQPEQAIETLRQAGTQDKADFVRLEPLGQAGVKRMQDLGAQRFREVDPMHTWMVDLRAEETQLRGNLSSGNRNIINSAERKGIEVGVKTDIKPFLKMLHETYQKAKIHAYDDAYYSTMVKVLEPLGAAKLYYASVEGQLVAGAIVYDFAKTRHYAHAAAFQDANRRSNAARVLVWRMMLDAKEAGLEKFDFWGVAPTDDPMHPWSGITQFKKSFGGYPVERIGTWDLPLKPAKYYLYRVAKKVLPI
jgi:hypothetical protein